MRSVGVGHQDQITSVAYDFYGRRMATCSVDHTIKVFDKVGETWQLNDSWRAHEAPVVKVSWTGPKHAPVLASGSHDCTVKLWEESPGEPFLSGRRWRRRYTISDFKGPVYDVEFCPYTTSLKLAAIAADGVLRIYEAIDASNLGYWTPTIEQPLLNRTVSRQLQSSFALSWSPTPSFTDWITVSVLDDAVVFKHDSKTGKYVKVAELAGHMGLIRDVAWAPSFGKSQGLIATACKDGYVRIFSIKPAPNAESPEPSQKLGGASAMSRQDGSESSPKSESGRIAEKQHVDESPGVPIQGFKPADDSSPKKSNQNEAPIVQLIHESADHGGEVWRVTWNSSGSILASTGDDAKVRFWKSMLSGHFKCMAVINGSERDIK